MNLRAVTALQRAARRLLHTPAFTSLVVGLLGVALAAVLTIGSAAHSLLWRPLPYPDAERLVVVQGISEQMNAALGFAPGLLDDLATLPGVDAVGGYDWRPSLYDAEGQAFDNVRIEPRLVALLGGTPQLGRLLQEDDGDDAVVLSGAAWRGRFGADASIIGRVVDFDGTRLRVVGVMEDDFRFPQRGTAMWRPLQFTPAQRHGADAFNFGAVQVIVKVSPGLDVAAFQSRMQARFGSRPELASMVKYMGLRLTATSLRGWWDAGRSSVLALLAGAAGALLLLLLANVGSLWLARGLERTRELAVSSALGATPRRLALESLAEVVLVSGTAVLLGLLAVAPGLRALEALGVLDRTVPLLPAPGVGTALLAVGVFATIVAALSFAPLWLARRPQALALLGQGQRGVGGSRSAQRARRALVALQIALAVSLLCGAGLLTRSLVQLLSRDVGFEAVGVSLATVESRRGDASLSALRDALVAIPGMQGVSVSNAPPFSFNESVSSIKLGEAQLDIPVRDRRVGAGYFATLGLPLSRGRDFLHEDAALGSPGVIVDQRFVDLHLGGAEPLGARVGLPTPDDGVAWARIVGVVPAVRHMSLDEPAEKGTLYRHDAALAIGANQATLVLRADLPQDELARQVRAAASGAGLRLVDLASITQRMHETLSSRLPLMGLTAAFALLGTLLAAVGLFALVAFSVQRRLPEFGVRLALGAPPARLQALALREGMRAAVPGLLIGVLGALAVGRLLAHRLYDVSATDPLTLVAVLAAALLLVLLACAGPARRAAKLDPASTLRHY